MLTTYVVWVLFLYSPQNTNSNNATATMITIDNIATVQECEAKLAEATKRWSVIKTGMCLQVTKVK